MMIPIRETTGASSEPSSVAGDVTCEEFQARIPLLMGGNIHQEVHLKSCERCTALIEELEYIGEIAKGLLPFHEPPDSVWSKIANSIHEDEGPSGTNGHTPK